MLRRILITGCSGGGKSTLLAALQRVGLATVSEPGRRIVAAELAGDGAALPWVNPGAFARKALALARADLDAAHAETVVFDRGLIDAAVALLHLEGIPVARSLGGPSPYDDPVILTPPWPEIHATDTERRHGLDEAVAEYDRLVLGLDALGHRVLVLPRVSVAERVGLILSAISGTSSKGF